MNNSITTRVRRKAVAGGSVSVTERLALAALGVALLLGLPGRAPAYMCTTPSLVAHQDYAVGASPTGVAVATLTATRTWTLRLQIWAVAPCRYLLGIGGGHFAPGSDIGVGSGPSAVAAGSFNNLDDANLDLAVADPFGGQVWILLGNGSGGFGVPAGLTVATNPFFVTVGT